MRKNLVLRFLDQKGPKWAQNEVFQVLAKMDFQTFPDFMHKVTVTGKFKIDINDFFGKNIFLRFFSIIKSQCVQLILFFA